jgi:rubrerythrin
LTWELTKAKEHKIIRCPFCDRGDIRTIFKPSIKVENVTRGSSVNKRTTTYTKEKYQVLEKCPHCGASKKKLEKALNFGKDYKSPSHKQFLDRIKQAGLPTKI